MLKASKLFVVVLLLALVPLTANATVGRLIGLGGRNTVFVAHDASEPGVFPSLTCKYPRLVGAEFWTEGTTWDNYLMYAVWDFPDKSAVKIILDNKPNTKFAVNKTGLVIPTDPFEMQNQNVSMLNAFWSRPFNDFLIGAALRYEGKSYTLDKYDQDTPPVHVEKVEASYSAYGLTAGITAMEEKLDAAVSVDLASFSRDDSTKTSVENDGTMEFGIAARYWCKMSDEYTLIPHVRFISHKLGWKKLTHINPDTTTAMSGSNTHIVFGIGNNWRPVEMVLVIFEIGVDVNSWTYDDGKIDFPNDKSDYSNGTNDIFYWRAGCETEINSWLWGRMGAERAWRSNAYEYYPSGQNEGDPWYGNPAYGYTVTKTYVGATTHWKRLIIDFVIEPAFFHSGPYFISGAGQNLTSYVSLKFDLTK